MIDITEQMQADKLTAESCLALLSEGNRDELLRRSLHDVACAARSRISHSRTLRTDADELMSIGTAAATEAVDKLLRKKSPGKNPLGFIRRRIKWRLKGICGNELIKVNGQTVTRASRRGTLDRLPIVTTGRRLESRCVPNESLRQYEFMDWMLGECCVDDEQRQILQLKHEGFSLAQIAKTVKRGRNSVNAILHGIERRAVASYQNNFAEQT